MGRKKSSFAQIQTEWYKKVKDSGFVDIEYKDGSIRSCRPRSARAKDPSLRQATQEYYYMAYHFLNEYEFADDLERIIWEYHSNGVSVRNICKLLKDAKVSDMQKTTAWTVIKRLESAMKLRYLSPQGPE